MTVVLVHGNPETDAIWGPLVAELGRDDVVRLSPPGFGAPMPADFSMTYLAYRDWLESDAGEELVEAMIGGSVEDRVPQLTLLGIPEDVATEFAVAQGPEMGRAILALYRSATEDTYVGSDDLRRDAAARAGARTEVLDGLGHWWMLQDPARGAQALTDFWFSLR